jgi:hypothetical protein
MPAAHTGENKPRTDDQAEYGNSQEGYLIKGQCRVTRGLTNSVTHVFPCLLSVT